VTGAGVHPRDPRGCDNARMSSAEPIMPPHAQPEVTSADVDDDPEVDILPDAADDAGVEEAPVEFPANPLFHAPTPGASLTEAELDDDLGE
jgi:hypothetical protein